MWSCKIASSSCSSVAPASFISTSATSASLPNLQLTCADLAKAEAILFHCSAYPLHCHCHPSHDQKDASPESPKQSSLHPWLSSYCHLPLHWHHRVHYRLSQALEVSKRWAKPWGPVAGQSQDKYSDLAEHSNSKPRMSQRPNTRRRTIRFQNPGQDKKDSIRSEIRVRHKVRPIGGTLGILKVFLVLKAIGSQT